MKAALDRLLIDKKRLVADRIKAVQEQETSKAQAKTEQMKKEIQRTREVQDEQRSKEIAVIQQQKNVEIAKQIAARELIEQQKLRDNAKIQNETIEKPLLQRLNSQDKNSNTCYTSV